MGNAFNRQTLHHAQLFQSSFDSPRSFQQSDTRGRAMAVVHQGGSRLLRLQCGERRATAVGTARPWPDGDGVRLLEHLSATAARVDRYVIIDGIEFA